MYIYRYIYIYIYIHTYIHTYIFKFTITSKISYFSIEGTSIKFIS